MPSPARAAVASPPPAPRTTVPMLGPESPLTDLKGVGPAKAALLAKLGLYTIGDCLCKHLPERHEDRSQLTPLRSLKPGMVTTAIGVVKEVRPAWNRFAPLSVFLSDGSGGLLSAVWFRQPHLARVFQRGQRLIVHGTIQHFGGGLRGDRFQMVVKDYEILEDGAGEMLHAGRLVPVYGLTAGVTQRPFRAFMKRLVDAYAPRIEDPLPEELRARHNLAPLSVALRAAHFPETPEAQAAARRRLVYDEFLTLQLGLVLRRHRQGRRPGLALNPPGVLARRLLASLPFALTVAQERVWRDVRADMADPQPMQRLLQGDVGSGKTCVAALAMVTAVESGYQAVLLAPTSILAEQHRAVLAHLLDPLGVSVALLTSATTDKERERILEGLADGTISCLVGTHSVIQDEVSFKALGLAVIDEQHRMGVQQRAALRNKGEHPDVLVMSATPIPRTLALTLHGDLQISTIDELPPGRQPVVTKARDESARGKVYAFLREQVSAGRQVYVVYPLVEESETSDLAAATAAAERLQCEVFPEFRIGLLHGRMSGAEKASIMAAFKSCSIDILVASTVVEIGLDIPNASVMVVEHAERFGLAQLHQLRGRIGRGQWKSYCILMAGAAHTENALRRIQVMTETSDGFRIAEEDLALRGPGEIFGAKQAGYLDGFLRVASLQRDGAVLEAARQDAIALIREDPGLKKPEHRALLVALRKIWAEKLVGA